MKYRFFFDNVYSDGFYSVCLVVPFDGKPYFKIFDCDAHPAAGFFTFEKYLEWLHEHG